MNEHHVASQLVIEAISYAWNHRKTIKNEPKKCVVLFDRRLFSFSQTKRGNPVLSLRLKEHQKSKPHPLRVLQTCSETCYFKCTKCDYEADRDRTASRNLAERAAQVADPLRVSFLSGVPKFKLFLARASQQSAVELNLSSLNLNRGLENYSYGSSGMSWFLREVGD